MGAPFVDGAPVDKESLLVLLRFTINFARFTNWKRPRLTSSGESRDYPFRKGEGRFRPRDVVAEAPKFRGFELFWLTGVFWELFSSECEGWGGR